MANTNSRCQDPMTLLAVGLGIVALKVIEKMAETTFSQMAEEMQKTSRKC
jgi:hypothetical protein